MNDETVYRAGRFYAGRAEASHARPDLDPGVSYEVWDRIGEERLTIALEDVAHLRALLDQIEPAMSAELAERERAALPVPGDRK